MAEQSREQVLELEGESKPGGAWVGEWVCLGGGGE